ncbi:helix-turn-helix transcriptional regulator [Tabrizicola soli]|uniref:Helix-turn-helix transcriptional regulator n=1 Tax=Tabrizicola soli TaxID=2185115 RepID=A0ABV7DVJ3_9RHOB|nr:helix-turn-helix domain-containing protein [Tabrizicola soli]
MMKDNVHDLLTVDRAADEIGIGRTTLFKLMRAGEGPPVIKLGALTRIRREALNAWLISRERTAA